MTYWHLQMNQPWGRDGGTIDSRLLLQRNPSVIATGEWDDIQCSYFKGLHPNGIKIRDIVLVREGNKPIALCRVTGDNFKDPDLARQFFHENYRQVDVLKLFNNQHDFPQAQGTLQRLQNSNTDSYNYIAGYYSEFIKGQKMKNLSEVLNYKKQMILQGPPGTGKTFTAKNLAEYIIFGSVSDDKNKQQENLVNSPQFKMVQFHPSYSYEDFVRGISAKSSGTDGKSIEYITENKVLADFANEALQNWKAVTRPNELSYENWLLNTVDEFKEYLFAQIENGEGKIQITKEAYIYRLTDKSIRYNADNWGNNDGGVPFSDLIKMYNANVKTRKEIKELSSLTKTAKSLSTYWIKTFELFLKFIKDNNLKPDGLEDKQVEKKYVLIIDEINRANLPTVLGELIYALEYRGCAVDSMYAIDDDFKLIIPDNLLIIGTMNTADRSVGHIDYAIRRRFAFINVSADSSVIKNEKAKALFDEIAGLFTTEYIAPDFEPEDIQIGHSYFICNDEQALRIKLQYEIIPILNEYLKDGILLAKAKEKIESIRQHTV